MANVRTFLAMASAMGAGFGCGSSVPPGVDPTTAYTISADIEAKARLAETDLEACKEDKEKCEAVAVGLRGIQDQSSNLQQTAVQAGAKPP